MTVESDVAAAKKIMSKLSKELGFVTRGALMESAKKKTLIVIDDVAFVNFRVRRDEQVTIYEVGVLPTEQRKGYGRKLLRQVWLTAIAHRKKRIFAKCPEDLPSNDFYKAMGFDLIRIEQGKKRRLYCWQKKV